jgi:hypothetical protein
VMQKMKADSLADLVKMAARLRLAPASAGDGGGIAAIIDDRNQRRTA